MTAIVIMLTWACATGIITTASRMVWSFARDRGTPFSNTLSYVSRVKRIPVVGVLTATVLAALLTLIYIGSSTAFNDIVSLTITGFYSSYLLPASFLLYHRLKGQIDPYKKDTPGYPIGEDAGMESSNSEPGDKVASPGVMDKKAESGLDDSPLPAATHTQESYSAPRRPSLVAQAPLQWGPFHLPGWFGIINNIYACVYM
jgi:choline transport protein